MTTFQIKEIIRKFGKLTLRERADGHVAFVEMILAVDGDDVEIRIQTQKGDAEQYRILGGEIECLTEAAETQIATLIEAARTKNARRAQMEQDAPAIWRAAGIEAKRRLQEKRELSDEEMAAVAHLVDEEVEEAIKRGYIPYQDAADDILRNMMRYKSRTFEAILKEMRG